MNDQYTQAAPTEDVWLSVAEAVANCTHRGLSRTAKTIRKWAARSAAHPEEAEISARREDTENGFRWVAEQSSLDRKIDEELEFEARKLGEQVRTSPDISEPVHTGAPIEIKDEPGAHGSEPVATRANSSTPARDDTAGEHEAFLKEQLEEKDRQITKLNEQIERKDDQIMTMLERDRETNLLINGLQTTLTRSLGIEAPEVRRSREESDSQRSVFHPRSVSAEPADVDTDVNSGGGEDTHEDV